LQIVSNSNKPDYCKGDSSQLEIVLRDRWLTKSSTLAVELFFGLQKLAENELDGPEVYHIDWAVPITLRFIEYQMS
jgi:hypothetical protein